jgi:aryl-alcohol dehydrogenase-like predicted oxidoreductase
MARVYLGNTHLLVSRLCFGTEPFTTPKGPIGKKSQGDLSPDEGSQVLKKAFEMGVNFWDTSKSYGTHPHVGMALGLVGRGGVVVADKSFANSHREAENAVAEALTELNTDYIDLMLLHNVPLKSTTREIDGELVKIGNLEARKGALRAFLEAKERGEIRAVGLSTHSTEVLRDIAGRPGIEVVCTTLNMVGGFLEDGSLGEHLEAIRALKQAGKGVYVMKLLDAGKLRDDAEAAIRYALQFHDFIDAWNIGMHDVGDVRCNLKILNEVLGSATR